MYVIKTIVDWINFFRLLILAALTDDGGSISQYQDLSIAPSSTDVASTTPVAKKSVLPGEGCEFLFLFFCGICLIFDF